MLKNFLDNISDPETFAKIIAIVFFVAFTAGFTIGTLTELSILLEK